MASPSSAHSSDHRHAAVSSHATQRTALGELACQRLPATAGKAACSAVAPHTSPPECPPCLPPSEWLRPSKGATDSSGHNPGGIAPLGAAGDAAQAPASASARRAEGDACDHADGRRQGVPPTVQHPLRPKSCAAEQAGSATTVPTPHTDAGAGPASAAERSGVVGGAAQPVQPPRGDASAPPGKAARHRKRDSGGRPKPPPPTHFMAIPLCQASMLPPADYHCGVAATRCNDIDGSQSGYMSHATRGFCRPAALVNWAWDMCVQEPGVVAALAAVQQALARHTPALQRACVATCTAHITLGVMHLPNEEQLQDCCDAVAALDEAAPAEVLQPFQLSLAGLSHFNHKVLYLDVVPDDGADTLQRLAWHVRDHLSAAGVDLDQGRGGFTPHVTVAKLSAMAGRGRSSMRKIPEAAYAEHVSVSGGLAGVSSVQLCCMTGRERDEYYQTVATYTLGQ